MHVLSIGNSFSEDATRYLHQIARADGVEVNVANLYIGGCPLERHFRNMHTENRVYSLEYNGTDTRFFVSLKEALLTRSWDVVTLQQASAVSFKKDSYFPYLPLLADYVKQYCPKAKLIIHQTWAYEDGSSKLLNCGFSSHFEMLEAIVKTYVAATQEVTNNGIIPSGELFGYLLKNGVETVHRDTIHATKGLGRYALGLLWYRMLTGRTVSENTFCDLDEPADEVHVQLAKAFADNCTPLL